MSITLKYYPRVIYGVGGDTVTFTVDAEGVASYQWQVGGTDGTNWTDLTWSGNKTATMTRALNANTATYQYRCALTDADGAVVYAGPIKIAPPTDKGLISGDALTAIADAIRAKTETTDKLLPADMAGMIDKLSLMPESITEIEVVECAGSGTYTLSIPCALSGTPACVAVYGVTTTTNVQRVNAGLWWNGQFIFWYDASSLHKYENASPLNDGVLTLESYANSSSAARFTDSTYYCVMWR